MVQIRRNHQRNDKQKSVVGRLLIIVIIFAVSIPLLYRYYHRGLEKNFSRHSISTDELINRTYLPSCAQHTIAIRDNFSFCLDSVSDNVLWFASEWRLTSPGIGVDSIIREGVGNHLSAGYSEYADADYFTDSVFAEAIYYLKNKDFSDTIICIAGPLNKQFMKRYPEKIISFFVAFDPEIRHLAAFCQYSSYDGKVVWKKTTIDEIENTFGIDFFHHYLAPEIEKSTEMRR